MKNGLLIFPLLFVISASSLPAQESVLNDISYTRLENGLDVFILENHSTPLVRIALAFRAGSIAQEEKTAGVMHLYEHMMFEGGSSLFPASASLLTEAVRLGTPDMNAFTSQEMMVFHFSLPAERIDQGLAYWSEVVRNPVFGALELENAKRPLINEIGEGSSPSYSDGFFSAFPWRKDVRGHSSAIKKADIETLKDIKARFFLPNDAAIFVFGALDKKNALDLIKASFGDWEAGGNPWKDFPPSFPFPGIASSQFYIAESQQIEQGKAEFTMRFRGPDLAFGSVATSAHRRKVVAAWLLVSLLSDSKGPYTERLGRWSENQSKPNSWFSESRDGSIFTLSFPLKLDKSKPAWQECREGLLDGMWRDEMEKIKSGAALYFGAGALDRIKNMQKINQAFVREEMAGFQNSLASDWAKGGAEWIQEQKALFEEVGYEDIEKIVGEYLLPHPGIFTLLVSQTDYPRELYPALENGFSKAEDLQSWWKRRRP